MKLTMMGLIALGGAIGSLLRFFVMSAIGHIYPSNFPFGTLSINIIGSIVMGAAITIFAHSASVPQHIQAFLTIGILGGFTTFSTFALDIATLYQRDTLLSIATYAIVSVLGSVLGLFGTMISLRWLLA